MEKKSPSNDLHRVLKGAKTFDLNAEGEITQLRIGEEDDEEHDRETGNIFRAFGQRFAQLSHRLVETDVFEDLQRRKRSSLSLLSNGKTTNFDPGEKDRRAQNDVELVRPVAKKGEIAELSVFFVQQLVQQTVHLDLPINVKRHADVRKNDDDQIQTIHHRFEIIGFHVDDLNERTLDEVFLLRLRLTSRPSSIV